MLSDNFCKSELKERGWTDSLIRDHLGQPCRSKHVRGHKHPMLLYSKARVLEAEASPSFSEQQIRSQARSEIAKQSAARRAKSTREAAATLRFKVIKMSPSRLLGEAIASYRQRTGWHVTRNDDLAFLERLQVNYARHELTSYDEVLPLFDGEIGVADAKQVIRQAVYAAIADAYPHLAEECDRQLSAR